MRTNDANYTVGKYFLLSFYLLIPMLIFIVYKVNNARQNDELKLFGVHGEAVISGKFKRKNSDMVNFKIKNNMTTLYGEAENKDALIGDIYPIYFSSKNHNIFEIDFSKKIGVDSSTLGK
jgi:hypothetical protein